MLRFPSLLVFLCLPCFQPVLAQEFDEQYSHWPEALKIKGHIIVNNGLEDFETARPVLRRLIGKKDAICFEPTHSSTDAMVNPLVTELRGIIENSGRLAIVESQRPSIELLKTALRTADIVSINVIDEHVDPVADLTPEISAFVDRGGILIAGNAWAERLGQLYLGSKPSSPENGSPEEVSKPEDQTGDATANGENLAGKVQRGMHLLPNCLLRCVSHEQAISIEGFLNVLSDRMRTVGIALEPSTMLVLSGRKMYCFGKGKTTFCLPASDHHQARVESIVERNRRSRAPWDSLVDLTQWRRDAIDRTLAPFPPMKPRTPHVEKGTLLIVGGGGSPRGLMDRFVELAGGPEKANLVYVPCSESDDVGASHQTVRAWQKMGVQHATYIHTKDRKKADCDKAFLAPLKEATGIWFGGGRQWNFSDSYYGTTAHKLMKEVLARGGVIGGSSAGASIQARYLARATPIGNSRIMAPGYERGGLGFIGGVAIDQHFSQRGRQKDMTALMKTHPQLLGIGIDETTAIEVQGSIAKVIGKGRTFFYDRNRAVQDGEPDYIALPSGSSYDLAKRKVLIDATQPADDSPNSNEVGVGD